MKRWISGCLTTAVVMALLSGCGTVDMPEEKNDRPADQIVTAPAADAVTQHTPQEEDTLQEDDLPEEDLQKDPQENKIIEISTPEELRRIEQDPQGSYLLTKDIDLSGNPNWTPLCSSDQPFAGTLDGNGYSIRNLNVDMKYAESIDDSEYAGLFCCVAGATIKNLGIVGGTVRISSVSNHGVAGALAGSSEIGDMGYDSEARETIYKMTEVINCWVNATVESVIPENDRGGSTLSIGAFIGEGSANFTNCYSVGKLAAAKKYADQIAGGFVGRPKVGWQEPMIIRSSYCLGQVSGHYFKGTYPGGLIGYAFGKEDIDIVNSYYGTDANGSNKILKAMTEIKDDTFTSVKGLTVEQMKDQSSFAGFDFNETWAISPDVNDGYPYLRVQRSTAAEETPTPAPEVQEPVTGDDRTPEELRKAILGEWMEDGMAVNYYAFFEDGSCKLLFQNSEPGTFEITEDRTLKFTTSWTKQTMEWNPESLYDLEGWYLTPEGKLIIEGNVLNRL